MQKVELPPVGDRVQLVECKTEDTEIDGLPHAEPQRYDEKVATVQTLDSSLAPMEAAGKQTDSKPPEPASVTAEAELQNTALPQRHPQGKPAEPADSKAPAMSAKEEAKADRQQAEASANAEITDAKKAAKSASSEPAVVQAAGRVSLVISTPQARH